MLSGAGVQRSGTPAESKHPYSRTLSCQGRLAVETTVAADGHTKTKRADILSAQHPKTNLT